MLSCTCCKRKVSFPKEGIHIPEIGKNRVWCSLKCANMTFDTAANVEHARDVERVKQMLIGPVKFIIGLFR